MSEIEGIARIKIYDGMIEEFKRLQAQCMESARTKDSGTLQYDLFFNDDCSECIVHERYRDSEALMEHIKNLGPLMKDLQKVCSISGEILGTPSAELKKSLEGQPVQVFLPYQSL